MVTFMALVGLDLLSVQSKFITAQSVGGTQWAAAARRQQW